MIGSLFLAIWQEKIALTRNNILIWTLFAATFVIIYEFTKSYYTVGSGKKTWDMRRLKLWFFGEMHKKTLNIQFAEMFISIYRSGLPITDVFSLIGNAIENKLYGAEIHKIGERIEQDESVADSVEQCYYFPYRLKNIFVIGQKTGEFDKNLDYFISQSKYQIELSLKTAMYVIYIFFLAAVSFLIIFDAV